MNVFTLGEVNRIKYLGVTITDNLNWFQHISTVIGKANTKIGFLWRNLCHCPRELHEPAYCALVHSVVEYSASLWDPHLRKDVNLLKSVQHRATHFITGEPHHMSSVASINFHAARPCCKSLETRRRDIRIALFYKAVHGPCAIQTVNILMSTPTVVTLTTCTSSDILLPITTIYRQSFFPRTIPQWNALSAEAIMLAASDLAPSEQSGPDFPPLQTYVESPHVHDLRDIPNQHSQITQTDTESKSGFPSAGLSLKWLTWMLLLHL